MLFRNLAFYRYEPRPRLPDAGFELLPELANNKAWEGVKDLPLNAAMITMIVVCMASLFRGSLHTPHIVSMLKRVLVMLSVGHTLRFCTYMATTMPGTTTHCLPGHLDEVHPPQPTTLREVFITRIALNPGNNCGDLMFSGHMFGTITPILMVAKYGKATLVDTNIIRQRTFNFYIHFMYCLIPIQGMFIIMMRNHYTSDVVVSCYLTPLLWRFYCDRFSAKDYEPVMQHEVESITYEQQQQQHEEGEEEESSNEFLERNEHNNTVSREYQYIVD